MDKVHVIPYDVALVTTEHIHTITKNTWLADSGASAHMTHTDTGMFNIKMIESKVTIGNGKSLTAVKMGSVRVQFATHWYQTYDFGKCQICSQPLCEFTQHTCGTTARFQDRK